MTGSLDLVINAPYSGSYVDYEPAVTRGLQSFHFPHVDGPTSIVNYAGTGSGTIVGTPTYDSNAATMKGLSNYLQTIGAESNDMTFLAVVATDDTLAGNSNNPDIMGNFNNNVAGAYFGLNTSSSVPSIIGRRVVLITGTPTSGTAYQLAFGTASAYHFVAIVFTNGVGMTIYNKTAGTSIVGAETRTPVLGTAIRAGSSVSTHTGTCRLAFDAHHNVALNASEVDTIYQQVKAYFAEATTPIAL